MAQSEALVKVRNKAISYSHPASKITTLADLDDITKIISSTMPHIISSETHLVLTLSKETVRLEEIVERIAHCSHSFSPHILKLTRRSKSAEDFSAVLNKIREEVLINNIFWDSYYKDSLLIYKIKQFKEQLS